MNGRRWVAGGCAVIGLLLLGGVPAHAELAWLESRVVLKPAAGAETAVALFHAVNRGKTPVRIASVRSGCGCTAASLDCDSIPPGGTATVQATYQAAGHQGEQTVALTVETEEPAPRSYDLQLVVHIKPYAVLTPEVRLWRVGDEVTSKVVRLSLANGFQFVHVASTTPDFAAVVVRRSETEVEVKVTPRDLWAKHSGSLVFQVGARDRTPIEVTAMLRVE